MHVTGKPYSDTQDAHVQDDGGEGLEGAGEEAENVKVVLNAESRRALEQKWVQGEEVRKINVDFVKYEVEKSVKWMRNAKDTFRCLCKSHCTVWFVHPCPSLNALLLPETLGTITQGPEVRWEPQQPLPMP